MEFIGSIFGYVLWFAYQLILFPSSIKQQKTMAGNARMQRKQAELREKYGNNREKLNEETQKLYEKEGINPSAGCLTSIIPMFAI